MLRSGVSCSRKTRRSARSWRRWVAVRFANRSSSASRCARAARSSSAWRRVSGETVLDHSEVVVLRDALGDPRLRGRRRDAVLYTTLEPCLMCMGTAMFFRVRRIVYALEAVADGASEVAQVWQPDVGHPPPGSYLYDVPDVTGGVCRDEALALFRLFAEQNRHLLWAQALLPDFARGEA